MKEEGRRERGEKSLFSRAACGPFSGRRLHLSSPPDRAIILGQFPRSIAMPSRVSCQRRTESHSVPAKTQWDCVLRQKTQWNCVLRTLPIALTLWAAAASAFAAGQVRLELVGSQGAALAFQEWNQTLSKAGIKNVRIRSGDGSDKPGVETLG